jgi:hypothetical protein
MGPHFALRQALVIVVLILAAPGAIPVQSKNVPPPPRLQHNIEDLDDSPAPPGDPGERKRESARAALVAKIRAAALKEVEAAAKSVTMPDAASLAKALDVESAGAPDADDVTRSASRPLGDLDGDGTPEVAFRWSRAERFKLSNFDVGPLPGWVMFLLSWDGGRWRVTELTTGDGLSGVEALPGIWPTDAILVVDGLSRIPYPIVFQYREHSAAAAWDSRADSSRYQGYEEGEVRFQGREGGPPVMIVSGRADPGVIRFPPGGDRGFEAATAYFWEQGAYVPKRTEFEENEDYTLYRFIAALHLRDFKAAFACIDPSKFLEGRAATPESLRKTMEETWPEFLGNDLFEVPEPASADENRYAFVLRKGDERTHYWPAFSRDGKLLLTGLERRKVR